jgi:hypothetical protein
MWMSHTNKLSSKFCCLTHLLTQIFPLYWLHFNANTFFIDEMKLEERRRQPGVGVGGSYYIKHNAILTGKQPELISIHTEKGRGPRLISFVRKNVGFLFQIKNCFFKL